MYNYNLSECQCIGLSKPYTLAQEVTHRTATLGRDPGKNFKMLALLNFIAHKLATEKSFNLTACPLSKFTVKQKQ